MQYFMFGTVFVQEEEQKKDHEAEPPAKVRKVRAKDGEATSFARRPCPKSSPSNHRWMAIRSIFKSEIRPLVLPLELAITHFEALVFFQTNFLVECFCLAKSLKHNLIGNY